MRWLWLVGLVACGSPENPLFPGATQIAATSQRIGLIAGDGETLAWTTQNGSGTNAAVWRLRRSDALPQKVYTFPPSEQSGGIAIVNHQPYFESWQSLGEGGGTLRLLTLDANDAAVEVGDGMAGLWGGDGVFLAQARASTITVADPRTGPERDPWQMTLTSDFGTYAMGHGKIVHALADGAETIELGTGNRQVFQHPLHRAYRITPAADGYFFVEYSVGMFHTTETGGTVRLAPDLNTTTEAAHGDDLWVSITTGADELAPTTTVVAVIHPDGSSEVRPIQAEYAILFSSGPDLMAVTQGVVGISEQATIWRIDD